MRRELCRLSVVVALSAGLAGLATEASAAFRGGGYPVGGARPYAFRPVPSVRGPLGLSRPVFPTCSISGCRQGALRYSGYRYGKDGYGKGYGYGFGDGYDGDYGGYGGYGAPVDPGPAPRPAPPPSAGVSGIRDAAVLPPAIYVIGDARRARTRVTRP
ncbi:MAG: hypothetical protein JO048_05970 [Methylobacteriaceae bacterium]|nr:hypothetical protein [Methylobacteriaceae bacterium]